MYIWQQVFVLFSAAKRLTECFLFASIFLFFFPSFLSFLNPIHPSIHLSTTTYIADPNEANSNYSAPLDEWFDYFPAEQFHIIQFEELQADPNTVVRRLKEFLGMDPDLPKGKELKNTNLRKSGGYNMTRGEYENLLDQVRWDSEKVADMLATRGLADKSAWLSRWQQVWDDNLATCDENGHCLINSN